VPAGNLTAGSVLTLPIKDFQSMLDVHVTGSLRMTQVRPSPTKVNRANVPRRTGVPAPDEETRLRPHRQHLVWPGPAQRTLVHTSITIAGMLMRYATADADVRSVGPGHWLRARQTRPQRPHTLDRCRGGLANQHFFTGAHDVSHLQVKPEEDILVNALLPGFVRTDMSKQVVPEDLPEQVLSSLAFFFLLPAPNHSLYSWARDGDPPRRWDRTWCS
jgi:hypothetical protein